MDSRRDDSSELKRPLDLICMGRAAVDFYAEQIGCSLETASSFAKYVGGCPANISIGTARLGLKSALLSRVGEEAMGRYVYQTMEKEGVDVSCLKVDKNHLTGLVLLGINPPDRFPLIFYRENCADMAISKEDYTDEFLASGKALLVTGTHCSNEDIFAVTKDAVMRAKNVQTEVIVDIDYRPVLWGKTGHGGGESRYSKDTLFAERMATIFPDADLIVGTEEELLAATGFSDIEAAIKRVQMMSNATIVQKRGEKGCVVYRSVSELPIFGDPFPVKVLNVLGAGDAFMSGFLLGYLRNCSIEECCTLGNANGALVVSRHGCSPAMPYLKELEKFLENPREIEVVNKLHQSLMHQKEVKEFLVLAFDHRSYFEELCLECRGEARHIMQLKGIIFEAVSSVKKELSERNIGAIIDSQYGSDSLKRAEEESLSTIRCIESPNSYPLQLLEGKEAAQLLRNWPKTQIIKVLCLLLEEKNNREQVDTLQALFQASCQTGHRLLIEIVEGKEKNHMKRIHEMMELCYERGIFPEWWKLQPIQDYEGWGLIEKLVKKHDPYIHGILLLGENRPLEELHAQFLELTSRFSLIKGFAVGRSIWGDTAKCWLKQELTDAEAIERIKERFTTLINLWKKEEIFS